MLCTRSPRTDMQATRGAAGSTVYILFEGEHRIYALGALYKSNAKAARTAVSRYCVCDWFIGCDCNAILQIYFLSISLLPCLSSHPESGLCIVNDRLESIRE